ncbi:MAG: hypothetical protein H6577_07680 [Lewinellaceae bacterium]|nr:hypothetical protein [Saprospiraceae bacterium]MCB9337993.1 hypothetical protein [Lewinellaceae bacterium]
MELNNIKSDLKQRIAQGLNFGIEAAEDVIDPEADIYNDFILLKSKYNDLMYLSTLNTLPYEQIEIGQDRLRNSLIGLIDRLGPSSLKKQEVNTDLKVQALPTRRTNFFKLLDIHFQNLEAIAHTESWSDGNVEKTTGRAAIFKIYQMVRRQCKSFEALAVEESWAKTEEFFNQFFGYDDGILEVYFKNIRHMMAYIMESEIERQFFLNTLRSLFSKFELWLIFHYALSGMDAEFKELVIKSSLVDGSIKPYLVNETHFDYLQ